MFRRGAGGKRKRGVDRDGMGGAVADGSDGWKLDGCRYGDWERQEGEIVGKQALGSTAEKKRSFTLAPGWKE
jgi:hypothetical protein